MSLNTTPRTWVTDEVVTATQMNTEVRDALTGIQAAWTSWTPALTATTTNPSLGSGTGLLKSGSYTRVGKTVQGTFDLQFGATSPSAGSGAFRVSLPVNAVTDRQIGSGFVFDSSSLSIWTVVLRSLTASTMVLYVTGAGSASNTVGSGNPFTWAAGDQLHGQFTYEAA